MTTLGLPKPLRTCLAAAARARVARLSNLQLESLLGDVTEALAEQLAQDTGVAYPYALRALHKALRQARAQRLGVRPAVSGTPPSFSMVLEFTLQQYVDRKSPRYGSRAAVMKAALALLMQADP